MSKLLNLKYLFGLILFVLLPGGAEAADRYLTCSTACTITAADTSIWGTVSGGTGASVPGSGDAVILDAGTCVGGTTCTATMGAAYNPTWQGVTQSACTASTAGCILDLSANNNSVTVTGNNCYVNTGSGTRTLTLGSGTWTCSGNFAVWNVAASMTLNAGTSNINLTGSGVTFTGGGKTYSTVTFGAIATSTGSNVINSANTFDTLTVTAPNRLVFNGGTNTVTTMTNVTGSSSQQVLINGNNSSPTMSSANNFTCTWCALYGMNFSGGGTFTAPNSFNLGGNTGITITVPSGGGGGRIIGG